MGKEPKKILLVDNDKELLNSLESEFDKTQFKIFAVDDGFKAIEMINDTKFHAILFDVNLPKMDGIQLAGYIKANSLNRDTHLFLMAENANQKTFAKLVRIELADLIKKPFDKKEVVERVSEIVFQKYPDNYDSNIIEIFSEAACDVIEYYFGDLPEKGSLTVRSDSPKHGCTMTGLIPLFGKKLFGSISLSCQKEFVELLCLKVFADRKVELTDNLRADLLRELINQIAGRAKRSFKKVGIFCAIGLPEAVIGDGHKVMHKVSSQILLRPLSIDGVSCYLEMCLGREIEETADTDEEIQFL